MAVPGMLVPAGWPVASGGSDGGSATDIYSAIQSLGLTSGLKMCLDVSNSLSYGGSGQTWSDLTTNGTDFYRGSGSGTDSADPSFHGTPGGLSSNEYWTFDGGDYFTLTSANPAWVSSMHKAGQTQTVACWFYLGSTGVNNPLIATSGSGLPGFLVYVRSSNNRFAYSVENGSTNNPQELSTTLTSGAWHFAAVSITNTNGSTTTWHLDGTSSTATNSLAITPSSSSAPNTLAIAKDGYGDTLSSGSRLGGLMVWQGTGLSGANLTSIYNATKAQFGL